VIEIPPSIAVLALDHEDHLLLIGQWRYTREKYSWELPIGGFQASDGDMQTTAARELREEAGVEAARWTPLGTLEASIGVTTDTQWLFLATGLTKGISTPDPEEKLAVRWVPFGDAVRMVLRDEIREAASTAAILKLDALRRYGLLGKDDA
jgi:8-oxo-dGTP pyrophosphatase MutT (NUDIX family)